IVRQVQKRSRSRCGECRDALYAIPEPEESFPVVRKCGWYRALENVAGIYGWIGKRQRSIGGPQRLRAIDNFPAVLIRIEIKRLKIEAVQTGIYDRVLVTDDRDLPSYRVEVSGPDEASVEVRPLEPTLVRPIRIRDLDPVKAMFEAGKAAAL